MDTEEMYRRGVADAERGEPHPFFYQHYYHYRRGYDQTRRRVRLPATPAGVWALIARLALAVGALALVWYGVSALLRPATAPAPAAAEVALAPTASPTAAPTRTPIFPTATAAPTPTQLALHVGGRARVVGTEGRPLRGRAAAGTAARAVAAFREGQEVRLLEGPVVADGYTWWRIEGAAGTGWSAQGSPEGVAWLTPIAD